MLTASPTSQVKYIAQTGIVWNTQPLNSLSHMATVHTSEQWKLIYLQLNRLQVNPNFNPTTYQTADHSYNLPHYWSILQTTRLQVNLTNNQTAGQSYNLLGCRTILQPTILGQSYNLPDCKSILQPSRWILLPTRHHVNPITNLTAGQSYKPTRMKINPTTYQNADQSYNLQINHTIYQTADQSYNILECTLGCYLGCFFSSHIDYMTDLYCLPQMAR